MLEKNSDSEVHVEKIEKRPTDSIAFGLTVRKTPKAEVRRRVDELLELVHLDGFAERLPGQLSGGQRQRMSLARALAVRPSVLLLDEPTASLDPLSTQRVEELVYELRSQVTVIIVTHEPDIAQYAHRVIDVRDGRIMKDHVVATPRRAADDVLTMNAEQRAIELGDAKEAA